MLWLSGGLLIFHVLIIIKVVPYTITWGGRLSNDAEMYAFEATSMGILLFLILNLLIKGTFIPQIITIKIVNIFLWLFFVLFILNTLGNIVAITTLEKFFTLVTLTYAVLLWIVLTKKKS